MTTLSCKGCGTPQGVTIHPVTFVPHCNKCNSIVTINSTSAAATRQQTQYVIYNIPTTGWANSQNIQITTGGSLGAGIDSLTTLEKKETPEEAYDRGMGVIK
jgi:hypothetical protein